MAGASGWGAKRLDAALDRISVDRWESARRRVDRLRAEHPGVTNRELAAMAAEGYQRELAVVGAVAGATAAVPVVGTLAALLAGGAEATFALAGLGEMVFAMGVAYGHEAPDPELRRAWLLSVLAMTGGVALGFGGLAASVERARTGDARRVGGLARLSDGAISKLNTTLSRRVAAAVMVRSGATRLGELAPFGIGAALGATGNALLARSVAAKAHEFFDVDPGFSPTRRSRA